MIRQVTEVIARLLHAAGVRRIHDVVGDSLDGIMASLRRRQKAIVPVFARDLRRRDGDIGLARPSLHDPL
jgi:thiamine pyrophosphate-dependent acetolactate synthase large subunit-like protein